MTTETEHEAFERWADVNDFNLVRNRPDVYRTIATQHAWEAWQARAALDQRQAFVVTDEMIATAWMAYTDRLGKPGYEDDWRHMMESEKNKMRAALQSIAQPVKVPDEWKLVPYASDGSMNEAASNCNAAHGCIDPVDAQFIWKAMLAAAPEYKS